MRISTGGGGWSCRTPLNRSHRPRRFAAAGSTHLSSVLATSVSQYIQIPFRISGTSLVGFKCVAPQSGDNQPSVIQISEIISCRTISYLASTLFCFFSSFCFSIAGFGDQCHKFLIASNVYNQREIHKKETNKQPSNQQIVGSRSGS